jgi:predicted ATPase
LLILLTSLFSEGQERSSLLLFDEPETSLHPWAIAVLAKAIGHATEEWGRQVILATHSPVLMSQFESNQSFAVELKEGRTQITRLNEVEGVQDLLEHYAPGSLYMSETVAGQSRLFEQSISSE